MTMVDPVFAQWLMADCQWSLSADAPTQARWGATAQTRERKTTIATKADAEAEAARQLAFMGQPMALDVHLLKGRWEPFRGQVITITLDQLDYDAGVDVFVLGAEDVLSDGTSRVTVLRRL